jgi:3-oxoacyl-[acyl-carrier protein] reductase
MADLSFEGRTVVVTGGAGDIGGATLRAFASRGATGYSLDRKSSSDATFKSLEVDVTRGDEVKAALDRVIAETGRLDAVIHAAGINRDHVVWKLSEEEWRSVISVNLEGAFQLVRHAVPHLREGDGGSIVLVSSINGERGKIGQSNYAASKAGLIGFARSVAREVGRFGVRVNVVAPGFIETAMTAILPPEWKELAVRESALGRTGTPSDVADAVLFLCSGMARHVTGQVLRVDGGQYM